MTAPATIPAPIPRPQWRRGPSGSFMGEVPSPQEIPVNTWEPSNRPARPLRIMDSRGPIGPIGPIVGTRFEESLETDLANSAGFVSWLPDMDLNHDKQIQSLLCYRYTIGQSIGRPS